MTRGSDMNHLEIENLLFAYLDRELGEAELNQVEHHLKTCGSCPELLTRYQSAKTGFSKIQPTEPSPAFTFQVMERLRQPDKNQTPATAELPAFLRWLFPALGYTFAFGLMFAAIVYRELPVSMENALLSDVPQQAQWSFQAETPEVNHWLGM